MGLALTVDWIVHFINYPALQGERKGKEHCSLYVATLF